MVPKIVHYDPKGFTKPDDFKFKFPFRDTAFYVSVDKAQSVGDAPPRALPPCMPSRGAMLC